ncbi:MAG: MBL fold metallo-hydrolase [Chloroflexota bacterium]|nr:MBL fold metallo-hydrolase [Chloroflexota bacterium]MDE2919641.1 MBL fold metallo-hydrolase [Chloroflexota bacterium]
MSTDLRLVLLGTGNPTPRAHRAGQSIAILSDGCGAIFDLGPGSAMNLFASSIDPLAIDQLFFTHHHFDHMADFDHFVMARWDQGAGAGDALSVYGPPPLLRIADQLFGPDGVYGPDLQARTRHPLSQRIHQLRGGPMPRTLPTLVVHELDEDEVVAGDRWIVTTGPARHVQPYLTSLSYRLETPSASVVISGDTRPLPALADFARDTDVLVHMAMDLQDDIDTWPEIATSCTGAAGAARIAAQANARRLVLVHLDTTADDPDRQAAILTEARANFTGDVILGEDFLEVPVTA